MLHLSSSIVRFRSPANLDKEWIDFEGLGCRQELTASAVKKKWFGK